jgi:uncharacterized membrane protein
MNSSENVPGQKVSRSSSSRLVNVVAPLILALQVLLTLVIYPMLPSIVPSHWDATGHINSYEPKWVYAGISPAISLGLYIILRLFFVFVGSQSSSQDSRAIQNEMAQIVLKFVLLLQQVLGLIVQAVLLMVALHAGGGSVH